MNTIAQGRIPALQMGQVFGSLPGNKGKEDSSFSSTAVKKIQESKEVSPLTNGIGEKQGAQYQTVGGQTELSASEKQRVAELQKRDAEVKAHERAHQAAGGQYTGGASFTYELGPDGRRYAIGGEVSIDMGAVSGNPSATAQKMRTVISAATAPADPSAQDRAVAQRAQQMLMQAQAQLVQERVNTVNAALGDTEVNEARADSSRVAAKAPFEEASTKYHAAHQLVREDYGHSKGTSNTHGYTGTFHTDA